MSATSKIGLTVLSGILLMYLLVTWVKRSHLFAPDETSYTIYFDNVSGLLRGDPVQWRGFTVGRVEKIRPKSSHVEVDIAIDASIEVYTDARAEIQVKELMGGKQIAFNPGTSGKAADKDDIIGGMASLDFSSSFSEVGDLLNALENKQIVTAANRMDSITTWLFAMVKNMDPQAPGRMLAQAENMTSELNRLGNLSKQTNWEARLKDYEMRLDFTLNQANSFLGKMDSIIDNLPLSELNEELNQGKNLLGKADQLVDEITGLITDAKQTDVLSGRLMYDKNLSKELDSTLYHLNETLKQIHQRRVIVGFKRKTD
ncbi:MAG: MlaD family protein [Bacteroidota bacterium]